MKLMENNIRCGANSLNEKTNGSGGVLQDFGDPMDRRMGLVGDDGARTEITDIVLRENGKESAWFEVSGKDFNCGGDVGNVGIGGNQEENWLTFSGYGGHTWRIKKKGE